MKLENWKSFLHPHALKGNLIKASIFIAAFELLKDNIVDHPKTFYTNGINEDGLILDENYQMNVLSRNRSHLYASLDWFKELGAITDQDIVTFNRLKEYRNKLSHELVNSILHGIEDNEYTQLFSELIDLFNRIDKWWILNFELAINSDNNIEQVDEESVQSGAVFMLKVMLDIVFSNSEEESWKYYKILLNEMR